MRRVLSILLLLAAACVPGSADGDEVGSESDDGEPEQPFDYCDGAPPDDDCYAAKRDPGSERVALAMAIADRYMDQLPADERSWGWREAVFMFSITELHRVSGEARYHDYAAAWMDHHIEVGYSIHSSDSCAPVAVAAFLWIEDGDPAYLEVLDDARVYLDEVALRDEDGALNHHGAQGSVTLWVDSLFMLGNVLTRWGEARDEAALLDDIDLQLRLFAGHLQGEDGLFAHAYDWPAADTSLRWGRGNGWAAVAMADYLRARTIRGEAEAAGPLEIRAVAEAQAQAALAAQDQSGAWWIIMNHPGEIYLETSTTALLAYGLARGYRYGIHGPQVLPAIDLAVAAVEERIAYDDQQRPYVTTIAGPTIPGDLDYYAGIDLVDDLGYGVGAVILALLESSGL
ncbi:MAG: glycoside hydrolase family 88 protein [Myxococcales bacterium]|nr:glycoside hydrolase family 88 protein [Myxococcales bacterium]